MTTKKCYKREYICQSNEYADDLQFVTRHPDGFTPGFPDDPSRSSLSQLTINSIARRTAVRSNGLSCEAGDYILREFYKILGGGFSIWRITSIQLVPNCARLKLETPNPREDSSLGEDLACELLDYESIVVDVEGEDTAEHRYLADQQSILHLQRRDEKNPSKIDYLKIHVWHYSKHTSLRRSEQASISIRHSDLPDYYYAYLYWKSRDTKRIIAEITEKTP